MAGGRQERDAAQAASAGLTEQAVADYLRAHPGFLAERPDLVAAMDPPDRHAGDSVVDFQQAMIARLRRENAIATAAQKSLIDTARANHKVQARVNRVILSLLEARNFEEVIGTIANDMVAILDLDVCTMVIESNGQDTPHVHSSGVRVLPPDRVAYWLRGQAVRIDSNIVGDDELFGPAAGLVRSMALVGVEVSSRTPLGMLCLGSRDPDCFQPGQATDLLTFLGGAVGRTIRAWLDLPA